MATLQRTAKRIYSPAALEYWFHKLESEWESSFRESVLAEARRFYLEGVIREVELGEGDAIIQCKLDKKSCYALIAWEADRLQVRGSEEHLRSNEVMAAAGLYEIEELVGDEVSPFSPEAETGGDSPTSSPPPEDREDPDAGSGRELAVELRVDHRGLLADPHWRGGGNGAVRALAANSSENGVPSQSERESLVRLTGLARKAGFEYLKRHGVFLLRDARKMGVFMKEELDLWRRYFGVDLDSEAKLVERGVQSLQLVGRAQMVPGNRKEMKLEWGLRCNGSLLDAELALRLARQGRGPALVRGVGLVELDETQADTIEESFVAQGATGVESFPRYLLFSRFADAVQGLHLSEELEAWKEQVNSLDDRSWALPAFFRPYQAEGVSWMAGHCEMGCHPLLADEMGLGKTVQVLGLIAARPLKEELAHRPHLVVCPASVVPVWKGEIERYFPQFQPRILRATDPFCSRDEANPERGNDVWLASYTQLRRHRHLLSELQFGYAVLDEAQQIKNPDAKVSQACMQIQAEHRIALTGTPLENRALDLWNLFRFLMPGLLGSRRSFERSVEGEGREEFLEIFKKQILPFTLRRTKAKVVRELPPKVEMELACPMTDLQVKLYRELVTQGEREFGNSVDRGLQGQPMHFFSLLTRLRQVCCDPDLLPGCHAGLQSSGKLMVLEDKLESILESGSKVVIFSQFTSLLDRVNQLVTAAFPKVPLFLLSGKTRDREAPVREFQDLSGGAVFLISLRAGGVGITLHAADYVFLLDPWWNPAVEAQAIDRVHRLGQENPVFVYRMVTRGTIEERVEALKRDKKELFDGLLGDSDGWAGLARAYRALSDLIELRSDESDT